MRAIFQLDLLAAVKRLICNRLNYQLWLGWTWLSNSCQAGQVEALTREVKTRRREKGEQATLELICAGQVVKLERTFSYSWAPVVPHQKKSEQQSGSRTTCPTCSQAVEAAAAQVVIPPAWNWPRAGACVAYELQQTRSSLGLSVFVCVCVFHTTYVSAWFMWQPMRCLFMCVWVCEGDLGEDKAPQIKLSTLLA